MVKMMFIKIFAVVMALTLLFGITAYSQNRKEDFGIYLADTGELVLSERHIQAYRSDDNALELNALGIKRWNSYLTYEDIPRLNSALTLFNHEFTIKIEGEGICRGRFWSWASSASYSGAVILESLLKLDEKHNCLWLKSDFLHNSFDPSLSSELEQFFRERNKLK